VNEASLVQLNPSQSVIEIYRVEDPEAELDVPMLDCMS